MKPAWPGPVEGGITQSHIAKGPLGCPFRAYLYYCLGLEEPRTPDPNLIWGNGCHLGLEHLIKHPQRIKDMPQEVFEQVALKVKSYLRETYPNTMATYPFTIKNMLKLYNDSYKEEGTEWKTEFQFKVPYTTRSGRKVNLKGKADGYCPDLGILVEHKCKGKIDVQQTREETPFDFQVLMYCLVLETRKVIYDIIRIPEAQYRLPPRSPYASPEGYADVIFDKTSSWDDYPITPKKHLWIQQLTFEIPEERIENFRKYQLDPLIDKFCLMYDMWCDPNFDPENPDCYGPLFYRTPVRHFDPGKTEKFKCEYHSFLTEQLGMNELVPVKSFYAELDNG